MKRTDLLKRLSIVNPTIAKNPPAEEMSCFRFDGDTIRGTNGRSMIQTKAPEGMDLDCTVPAAKFFKLISHMTADDVELELVLKPTPTLKIKAGRTNAKYKVFTEGGMLDNLNFEPDEWTAIPTGLTDGLNFCKFAVSTDSARGSLCGVQISNDCVVASDGQRIARMPVTSETKPFVLSVDLIDILLKHVITDWGIGGPNKETVYFRTEDNTVIAGQAMLGDFPDTTEILSQVEELTLNIDMPAEVDGSLSRHLEQQMDMLTLDKEVTISIADETLSLHSADTENSYTLDETFDLAEKASIPMAFKVHPEFLKDILGRTRTMRYSDDESLKFVAFTTATGFQYLTCVDRV